MRKEAIRELAENIHIMDELNPSEFEVMQPPAVTIYIPIHHSEREGRRDEWDRIEFKDLAKEAKNNLQEHWGKKDVAPIVEKLDYILSHEDLPLWIEAKQGLAFLLEGDECYVYNMDIAPEPKVVVSDKFDMGPILGEQETSQKDHYKLLLLNSDFFALLEGDEQGVSYIPLPDDVKNYFAETFPEFDGETTALDYYSLEDHEPPYHNHKSRNDVKKEEAEKFFRYVDKALNDKLLLHNTEPVILVTDPEHVHMFKEVCTFKLYPEVIEKDPRHMTGTELRDAALKLLNS